MTYDTKSIKVGDMFEVPATEVWKFTGYGHFKDKEKSPSLEFDILMEGHKVASASCINPESFAKGWGKFIGNSSKA